MHLFENLQTDTAAATPLHLYYLADNSDSETCSNGIATVVILHCNPLSNDTLLRLPKSCPDGTCDGLVLVCFEKINKELFSCLYQFIVDGKAACPLCSNEDYTVIVGECINGMQTVHRVPPAYVNSPQNTCKESFFSDTAPCPHRKSNHNACALLA